MTKTLHVKHTVDRHGQPLLEIDNLGQVAELSPAAARRLAAAIIESADDCEIRTRGLARRYMVAKKDYPWGQP